MLDWSGQKGYQAASLQPWYAKRKLSERSGIFKSHGNLTFATVAKASHFVPYDKPEESLLMYVLPMYHAEFGAMLTRLVYQGDVMDALWPTSIQRSFHKAKELTGACVYVDSTVSQVHM